MVASQYIDFDAWPDRGAVKQKKARHLVSGAGFFVWAFSVRSDQSALILVYCSSSLSNAA